MPGPLLSRPPRAHPQCRRDTFPPILSSTGLVCAAAKHSPPLPGALRLKEEVKHKRPRRALRAGASNSRLGGHQEVLGLACSGEADSRTSKACEGNGGSQAEEREALLGSGSRLCKGRGTRKAHVCRTGRAGDHKLGMWVQVTNDLPSQSSNLKATGSTETPK